MRLTRVFGWLMAAVVLAAPAVGWTGGPPTPFVANGPILAIDAGDVKPAGKSGRFVVKEREVTGLLFGSIGAGDGEPFSFTFGTNVPLMTQSGQVHGTLVAGGYQAKLHAKSQIGLTPIACAGEPPSCVNGLIPGLLLDGTFTFTGGAQGHGRAAAWIIPDIDPVTWHIVGVLGGWLTLTGQWHE